MSRNARAALILLLASVLAQAAVAGAPAAAVHRPAGRMRFATGQMPKADASGPPVPVGDLPGWHQVFAEDFDVPVRRGGFSGCTAGPTLMRSQCPGLPSALRERWWAYPDGWPDTERRGVYYPSRVVSIHDGVLDYFLHSAHGMHMVAALVPKIPGGINGGGLRYGAYVVRFRAEPVSGYKTAWLLWPDREAWPAEGEIDFPEGNLAGRIGAFMHPMGATAGSQQDAYPTSARFDAWHTATIEWTPGDCRFLLDGVQVGNSSRRVPRDPMHWVLQTETATEGAPPSARAAGHVLIAWVAVYVPSASDAETGAVSARSRRPVPRALPFARP